MPAPSVPQLLDYESQLEGAIASILTAGFAAVTPALPPVQILVSRDSDTMEVPRVEIQVECGPAILQYTTIGQANPRQVTNAFEFKVTCMLCTGRQQDNARMSPLHPVLRGLIRYYLSAGAKAFTSSNLPYLQVLQLLLGQGRTQLQQNKEQDLDALIYEGKCAIANDAWPASA